MDFKPANPEHVVTAFAATFRPVKVEAEVNIKIENSGDDYPGWMDHAPYRAYYQADAESFVDAKPIKAEPLDDTKPVKPEPASDDSGVDMHIAPFEMEAEESDSEASTISAEDSEEARRLKEEKFAAYCARFKPRLHVHRPGVGPLTALRAKQAERRAAEKSARRKAKRDAEIRARRARDAARRHVGMVVITARENRLAEREFTTAGGKAFA